MNILITGGAGYKGTKLSQVLLKKGHKVTCIDNFPNGADAILSFVADKNYTPIKKDIREITQKDLKDCDVVIHLAGLSGFISCQSNPSEAKSINVDATKKLVKHLSRGQFIIYPSTTSLYGNYGSEIDEEAKPLPSSIYAITKYEAEKISLSHCRSVALRFASVFGSSLVMRHDLMVHDFIKRAINDRVLVLYDSKSTRTFIHIDDAISAYLFTVDNLKRMNGNIYNVGFEKLNLSKADLANEIKEKINFEIIESNLEDKENRDYIISYKKMISLGFKPDKTLQKTIPGLVKYYSVNK